MLILCILSAAIMVVPEEVVDVLGHRVELMKDEKTDNRSTESFNIELSKMAENGEILLGRGTSTFYQKGYGWGNTGIKGDLYKFGVFGVTLVIIAFAIMVTSYSVSFKTKAFAVLFFSLLYYNGDIKYALFIYIPLINYLNYNKQIKVPNKEL